MCRLDKRQKVKKVEKLPPSEEYVYDISVAEGDHYFFANQILVSNTDSSYFTAYPILKDDIEKGNISWTREDVISLYDSIGSDVNDSFPAFMKKAFNAPQENGEIIKCAREIVGSSSLFITKKRYALMVIDKEGSRKDVNGKPGSVKAMGMDLKRSDTPSFMQDFLMEILIDLLGSVPKEIILEKIKNLKQQLHAADPWTLGTPKRVNKLTWYSNNERKHGKTNMPGHVRAAYNWNFLKDMYGDKYSGSITDGQKTIVCKVLKNPMGFTSIAYPIDESRLPDWFKNLPFDRNGMLESIVDAKIKNLLGVLNWDLSVTDVTNSFNDLFSIA